MRAGREAERTVATFTDGDPNARARDYQVTIRWGDRQISTGWVRRAGDGSFEVRGEHRYAKAGTYDVVVKIADDAGHGVDAPGRAIVTR